MTSDAAREEIFVEQHIEWKARVAQPYSLGAGGDYSTVYLATDGRLMQASVSASFGDQIAGVRSELGFGHNWSESSENTFGPGLDDQVAAELFYGLRLWREGAISPEAPNLTTSAT